MLYLYNMNELIVDSIYLPENKDSALIDLSGSIDILNIPVLGNTINNILNSNVKTNIILDFSSIEYVERNVWDFLVNTQKNLNSNGINIAIVNMNAYVLEEYKLLEISTIPVYDNFESAFYSFGVLLKSNLA